MTTMTFLVNGAAAGHAESAAWVTINELEGGKLSFKVVQSGDTMGHLRGVFFDVTDESILNTLRIDTASNDTCLSDNSSKKLEVVTKMDGSSCEDDNHSSGLEIKRTNVSRKNTNNYSFTLNSTKRELSIGDFSKIQLDHSEANSHADTQCNDDYSHRWLYLALA